MPRVFYYLNALLSVGFLRVLAYFPYPWVARFGEVLGYLLFFLPTQRKRIVLVNLQACFPDWSEAQCLQIAHQVFRYVIRSFAERSIFWFASVNRLRKWVKVDGWYGPDEAKKEILSGVENYKRDTSKA